MSNFALTLDSPLQEHPAGGLEASRFDCHEVWYPISFVADLDRAIPTRFTILDQDIVIWWDKNGSSWRVFNDQCPHRLATLSEGRINENGLLECPYHGWTFLGSGECDHVPQQPPEGNAEKSQRACVKSYPTAIGQGLLFIYPGKPENAELTKIPIVEPIEENPDEWVCFNIMRDLPYDALTLMENLLDPSHLPYTHHKTVGNRVNAGPVELEVIESNRQGFKGFWKEGPRKGTLGSQETIFIAPGLMWHDITSNKSRRSLTVAYATPIRKGECRLFARFPFKFPSKFTSFLMKSTPTWYLHLGQNGVLEDDQIFLHYQERYLEAMGGSENFAKAFYLPTKADRFVMELHQWINLYNGQPFPGEKLSPPLSKEILLERYHSHTKHCASCRGALARIKKVKMAVVVMGAIAWFLLPYLAFFVKSNLILGGSILGVIVVISGITWLKLNNLEKQFYQGREIPPRNFPEKP